jgi:hypothetical protein
MKRHIAFIVYHVEPCKMGDNHRVVLEFVNELDAIEFLNTWYQKYDFNFTCLVLMKVLR